MTSMRRALLRRAASRKRPVAVIDANLLRNQQVVAERQARYRSDGEQIVVADAVWNEILTNESWPSTLRASFEYLAKVPEALVASWSVAAMQAGERLDGEPARDVVHGPMSAFLRQLVVDLSRGGSGTMNRLRAALQAHGLNDKASMATRRKEATTRLVELGRDGIPHARLKASNNALRDGDRGELLDIIAEVFEPTKICVALVRQGVDADIAERLTSQPTVNAVINLFFTHMAVEWAVTHGVENAKVQRIHNDYVDVEYAVVAWACGGEYVTADARARARYEDVMLLCKRIWPLS